METRPNPLKNVYQDKEGSEEWLKRYEMAAAMGILLPPGFSGFSRGRDTNIRMPQKSALIPKFTGLNIRCARIGGVEIPNNKRIEYSLQYIHGIGRTTARQVLHDLGMENKITRDLVEDELTRIRGEVNKYMIEGDLPQLYFEDMFKYLMKEEGFED